MSLQHLCGGRIGRLQSFKRIALGRIAALALLLMPLGPAAAASSSFEVSDGICQYRIAFDPAVYDKTRLKATFDYLYAADLPIERGPPLNEPADLASIDLAQVRADCAAHRAALRTALRTPQLVDVAGLETLRQRQLAELDDSCAMLDAELRAAKGETDALRAYAPATPACTRYADALARPDDKLKTAYSDLLDDLCRTSTERNRCMDHLQKAGEGPGKIARMRLVLLTQGWAECARATMLVNKDDAGSAVEPASVRAKGVIRDRLVKRFKVKTLSCAQ